MRNQKNRTKTSNEPGPLTYSTLNNKNKDEKQARYDDDD